MIRFLHGTDAFSRIKPPALNPFRLTGISPGMSLCRTAVLILVLLVFVPMDSFLLRAQDTAYYEIWNINNLNSIGGHAVSTLGDPVVVDTENGSAVEFDGVEDQLLVDANPIGEALEFTVEVIFWPEACYPENTAPRFVHIQDPEDSQNKRVMIELRLNAENQCYLDGFMLTDNDDLTLIDDTLVHPTETWLHAAITYKEGVFTTYVNGVEELSGQVDYQDQILGPTGKTSLGARMNGVAWFRGKIKTLKVTRKALSPQEFLYQGSTGSNPAISRDNREALFSVYPVPADHELTIEPSIPDESGYSIGITDLCGRILSLQEVSSSSSPFLKINTSGLENGFYLLRIWNGTSKQTTRILIRHPD